MHLFACHSFGVSVFLFVIGSESEIVIPVDAKIETIVPFDWIFLQQKR